MLSICLCSVYLVGIAEAESPLKMKSVSFDFKMMNILNLF